MTSSFPVRNPKRCPTHPGAIFRDVIMPSLGLSKTAIAQHLGVSRQTFYDLLSETQAVTPRMAVRLGKLVGNGPAFWVNMQTAYDLWHAARDVDVSAIPTLKESKPDRLR